MTIEGILLGLVALVIGAAFCFYGFQFFLILLPLWAFVAGFAAGAQLLSLLFGDGFLATVTGWVVGFVVGIGFALISYLWYWAAVVLLGGLVGYEIGVGLMAMIGLHGFGAAAVGIILGAVFAIGTILLGVPRILVVVLTALGGAATIVAGVLLIIGKIPVSSLGDGVLGSVLADSLFWYLVFVVLAIVGAFYQLRVQAAVATELDRTQWRYA